MTQAEIEIVQKLAEAHNLFIKLGNQHGSDIIEWCAGIHSLQRIVMARDAVRTHPDVFTDLDGIAKPIPNFIKVGPSVEGPAIVGERGREIVINKVSIE